jgi:hypothetical protein
MALPTFKAAGTFTAGTGAITPPYPASPNNPVAGDIALLVCESENEAISLSSAQGFVELGAQANKAAGTAASDPASRLAVYWKRCVGADTAPTVADSGNHTTGQIYLFTGCIASGNPWDVYAEGNDSGANDTTGIIPGATTTVANCLIVLISTSSYNGNSTTEFSAWTNANLANIVERGDNTNTAGLGGGHGLATGEKASAGAYGDTTVTLAHTSYKGAMSIALKPPIAQTFYQTLDAAMANFAAARTSLTTHKHDASMSTFDGAQTRLTACKRDASMSTFTGTVTKFTSCIRTASMATFAGSTAKLTQRALSAVMADFAGVLTSIKLYTKELVAGMATFAAALSRISLKGFASSMANFGGQTAKSTAHALSAVMADFAGLISKRAAKAINSSMSTFAASLGSAGIFLRTLAAGMASFAGIVAASANFHESINAGMASFGGSVSRFTLKNLEAAVSAFSASVAKHLGRAIAASMSVFGAAVYSSISGDRKSDPDWFPIGMMHKLLRRRRG